MVGWGPTPEEEARVAAARDLGRQQQAYEIARQSGQQVTFRPALGGPQPTAPHVPGPVGDVRAYPASGNGGGGSSFGGAVIEGFQRGEAERGRGDGGDQPSGSGEPQGAVRGGTQNAEDRATGTGRGGASPPVDDTRVRLRPLNPGDFYGSGEGIMSVLQSRTNGLLFPYTPTVQFSQTVDYSQLGLVHSIGDILAFQRTPSVEITISGKFTVQNMAEGLFALGCLHFCRVASKMRFGQTDENAGLPPPMLLLTGYGTYMFNDLRCVLKSHSWSFDENMNLVTVQVPNGKVRLPPVFTLSVTVAIQNTPQQMRTVFNADAFRSGKLMANRGWI